MVEGLVLLLAGQLMGEALVTLLHLPIPGPVVGMLLVLLALICRKGQMPALRRAGTTVLSLVPLLLIPVSVGVMVHGEALSEHWLALSVALALSMVAGLVATGFTIRFMRRFDAKQDRDV